MKKLLLSIALLLGVCGTLRAQGGNIHDVVFRPGIGIPGVNAAVCQPLSTTAASVTNNIATLTMASNPVSAGFVAGMTIQVAGFTGADTYFNAGSIVSNSISNGFTILSVTPTTINFTLVHTNASATSNGTVLQQGNSTTACASLSSVFTDSTLTVAAANPSIADGLGNFNFWASPGQYEVQLYAPTITTKIYGYSIACVPSNTVNCGALLGTPNTWTAAQTDSALHTFNAGISSFGPNSLLGSTTIGSSFIPQFAGVTPLGSTSLPLLNIILGGAAGQTTTQTSTATANRTATWPDASGTPSLAAIEYCGATSGATQACAKTVQTLPIMVWGDVLLNGATTQSITTLPFTDALYSCSGSDLTTPAGVVAFNTYAAASVTIQETGGVNTDHLRYVCVGH